MQKWVLYYRSIVLFDNIYVKSDVFKYDYYKQSNYICVCVNEN